MNIVPSSAEDRGPEPLQATPTMQTPQPLLDLPSSAGQVSNKADTPIAPLRVSNLPRTVEDLLN